MKKKIVAMTFLAVLLLQTVSFVWAWEIERPSYDIPIGERIGTANSDGKASAGLGVAVHKYYENDPRHFADYLYLNVSMTANSRKGITYGYNGESFWWIDENDLGSPCIRTGVGDEWGEWVDFPYEYYGFRFYGGPGSAQYTKVWISSNGFISFDPVNLTCPNPSNYFPPTKRPNAVIAAVWSDLDVDGEASITTGCYEQFCTKHFVITWKNIRHKASGQRLTFQITLRDQTSWYAQSQIWISYQNVTAITTKFAVGIEDHEGCKGTIGLCEGQTLANLNGQTFRYYQTSNTFFLKRLTIALADECTDTRFKIEENGNYMRGYNMKLKSTEFPEPDSTYRFATALAGAVTLLLGGCGGIILVGCTVVDSFLVYLDVVEALAYYQYSRIEKLELRDQFSSPPISQGAYIKVPTEFECVDATLSIVVDWVFDDPNNEAHSLTVSATTTYAEYDTSGLHLEDHNVTTSATLNVVPDAGNDRSSARLVTSTPVEYKAFLGINLPDPPMNDDPDDYYKINVPEHYLLTISMVPPANANFDLYLYYGNNSSPVASSTNPANGEHEFIPYLGFAGTYYIRAKCVSSFGLYNLYIHMQYHFGPLPPGPLSTNRTSMEPG